MESSCSSQVGMNKKIFFLILLMVFMSFAQARPSSLDSVKIYQDLIEQEDKESSCALNAVGIAFGGTFIASGAYLIARGIYILSWEADDGLGSLTNSFVGGSALMIGIPLFAVGIPMLVKNIRGYKAHSKHATKRDEYQESLNRYMLRQQQEEHNSVQLMIFPSVNLANAGFGANAVLLF